MLSVYNHRFDRQKWNCVIPKETKLTSIAVSSVAAGSQNNSSHGIPVNPRFLCVGTAKGHVYCWCLLTGALLKIFKAHLQKINAMCFTGDGSALVTGSDDCSVKVWKLSEMVVPQTKMKETTTNTELLNLNLNQFNESSYDPATDDVKIENENINTSITTINEYVIWKDHLLGVTDIFCGSGNISISSKIYTCSYDCTVKIYSLLTKTMISDIKYPNPLTSIRLDPTMSYLITSTNHGELFRLNLNQFPNEINITHAIQTDPKTQLQNVTYHSQNTEQIVAITGLDMSYDGRLCVTTHSDGTACVWDVTYGAKVRVLNKNRKSYEKVVIICDRLGVFGDEQTDIKYEKYSYYQKNWPPVCKRFFNNHSQMLSIQQTQFQGNFNTYQMGASSNINLVSPPEYINMYVGPGSATATELGVTAEQRMHTDFGICNQTQPWKDKQFSDMSYWSDNAFLQRMNQQFSKLSADENGWIDLNDSIQYEWNDKMDSKKINEKNKNNDKNMDETIDITNDNNKSKIEKNKINYNKCKELTIEQLLHENRLLKGEIEQWQNVHKNLLKFTRDKILGIDSNNLQIDDPYDDDFEE